MHLKRLDWMDWKVFQQIALIGLLFGDEVKLGFASCSLFSHAGARPVFALVIARAGAGEKRDSYISDADCRLDLR